MCIRLSRMFGRQANSEATTEEGVWTFKLDSRCWWADERVTRIQISQGRWGWTAVADCGRPHGRLPDHTSRHTFFSISPHVIPDRQRAFGPRTP